MSLRFARSAGAAAVLVALVAAPAAASPVEPAGEGGGGNFCTIAGAIATDPGITYMPATATFTLQGVMDCTSDTYGHGDVTGKGTGTLGCSGGMSEAVLEVAWGEGKTSTINLQLGDFTYGTGGFGTVAAGEMNGEQVGVGWGREAAGAEARCASGKVTSYQFAGGMAIGSPA